MQPRPLSSISWCRSARQKTARHRIIHCHRTSNLDFYQSAWRDNGHRAGNGQLYTGKEQAIVSFFQVEKSKCEKPSRSVKYLVDIERLIVLIGGSFGAQCASAADAGHALTSTMKSQCRVSRRMGFVVSKPASVVGGDSSGCVGSSLTI